MRLLAVLSIALVATLTLSATYAPGNLMLRLVEHVPGQDVTAHFAALGLTAFAVTRGFGHRAGRFGWRQLGPSLALLIAATGEEFSQQWIPWRTFSFDDLLANTFGIVLFTAIALVSTPAAAPPNEPVSEAKSSA